MGLNGYSDAVFCYHIPFNCCRAFKDADAVFAIIDYVVMDGNITSSAIQRTVTDYVIKDCQGTLENTNSSLNGIMSDGCLSRIGTAANVANNSVIRDCR